MCIRDRNKSGKPSVKIANDYLTTQTDLKTPENLKFILEAASQVDCQCFDLFEQYKSDISKVVDEDVINAKVRQACNNTVKRAIEFESPELIGLAADAMKRNIPAEADRFRSDSEIRYALALHDMSRIGDLVNTCLLYTSTVENTWYWFLLLRMPEAYTDSVIFSLTGEVVST